MRIRGSRLIGVASAMAAFSPAMTLPVYAADSAIEEVIVTGIRASLQKAIDTKRESNTIVDAISAEDVGKFPDKNVAEALQRVPGVVINREFGEGERVSLRGTAPNLTRTLLNGHGLATADWFILDQLSATRSFNYLILPSDVIGQVNVFKSPQADFEEGGIGGTINVITRNPLDLEAFSLQGSIQDAYTDMSSNSDPQGSLLFSWKNQDSTFGVLAAAIYQERHIRRDGIETLGYFDIDAGGPGTTTAPSLIGSALFEQDRIRKGGNIAVQWEPSESLSFNLTGLYSVFDADNVNRNYLTFGSRALDTGGTLTNPVIQGDTVVAGTITSNPNNANSRAAVYDVFFRDAVAKTYSVDLDTKVVPNDNWTLHFQVGYTAAEGDTKSQPFVEFAQQGSFDFDLRGGTPKVNFKGINPLNPNDLMLDFASLNKTTNDDNEAYGYADAEVKLDIGFLKSLKFGIKTTDHERDSGSIGTLFGAFVSPLLSTACGGPCTPASFASGTNTPSDFLGFSGPGGVKQYFDVSQDAVTGILFGVPGAVSNRVIRPNENFGVEEKTYGTFVMGNLSGEKWRGNVGVRAVRTEQESRGNAIFTGGTAGPGSIANPFGAYIPVKVDRDYTDVLPSANLAFDLTDQLVLKVGAAKTIARPDFTDVVPRVNLNETVLSGTAGDPNIDPFRAKQFDASLEWYPAPNTAVAFALFYKDIKSFITDAPVQQIFPVVTAQPNTSRCTFVSNNGTPIPGDDLYNCSFDINKRSNGGGGDIKGLEISGTAPVYGGFGVQANFTYSDAEADSGDPIPGNSRRSYNVAAFYEDSRVSTRLAYTYRSQFFVTFDRATPLNQTEIESLDASFLYNINTSWALTVDAVNLTNDKIRQFAGQEFRSRAIYENGRIYYAGVRAKF